ncbi:hypothetical protein MMC21_004065 [Puttea exsequens]|nr:hypothetical protein [Puttea exsequens]
MRSTIILLSAFASGAFAAVPEWSQCGGKEYSGPTDCASGLACLCLNPYYWQCLTPGMDVGTACADAGITNGNPTTGSPPVKEEYSPPDKPKTRTTAGHSKPTVPAQPVPSSGSQVPTIPAPSTGDNSTESGAGVVSGACAPFSGDKTGYATTTNYYDNHKGACGCGTGTGDGVKFPWQQNPGTGLLTAAGSQNLFAPDDASTSNCGGGCGTCYELTNANAIAATGQGDCTGSGQTITVMVTNLCPANSNQQWCNQPANSYGFASHFDLMGSSAGGLANGWNNPVVTYKKVTCPATLTTDFSQCVCTP